MSQDKCTASGANPRQNNSVGEKSPEHRRSSSSGSARPDANARVWSGRRTGKPSTGKLENARRNGRPAHPQKRDVVGTLKSWALGKPPKSTTNRPAILLVLFAVAAVLIMGRLFYLQAFDPQGYSAESEDKRTHTIPLPASRGTITDRNGVVIASSVPASTVYCNPQEVNNAQGAANMLAEKLGESYDYYYERLTRTEKAFVYIARQIDSDLAEEIANGGYAGLYVTDEAKRVYPYNGVGSQIIGRTNAEGEGTSGLEAQYDELLTGVDGQVVEQRGRDWTPITGGQMSRVEAQDGSDIVTTIDIELQTELEDVLRGAISDYSLTEGAAIVYSASTGEIYAAAQAPLLATGENWRQDSASEAFALFPVTGTYEPGSTFKSITAASVCDAGAVTPDTVFSYDDELSMDDFTIHDDTEHGYVDWTLRTIIANSSNVGTVLASQSIERETYDAYIKAFGFGQQTGVDYPNEASGVYPELSEWSSATAANIPFGQGLTVTPLQMVRAYGCFLNGGVMEIPHFLLDVSESEGTTGEGGLDSAGTKTQVISAQSCEQVEDMLREVVSSGTATSAQIEGYAVAGKSGSAQYVEDGSYVQGKYITSFIGYLPDSECDLVVMVMLKGTPAGVNPTPGYVSELLRYIINLYGVEPNA